MSFRTIAGFGLVLVGVLLLIGAGVAWMRRGQFLSAAVEAPGDVVGHVSSDVSRPAPPGSSRPIDSAPGRTGSSSPIIEFRTREGRLVRFTSGLSSFEAGQDITVLYLPDNPERAEVKNPFAQTGWILIMAVLGVGLVIGGWFLRSIPVSDSFPSLPN
jgi:hypothetical protein